MNDTKLAAVRGRLVAERDKRRQDGVNAVTEMQSLIAVIGADAMQQAIDILDTLTEEEA